MGWLLGAWTSHGVDELQLSSDAIWLGPKEAGLDGSQPTLHPHVGALITPQIYS